MANLENSNSSKDSMGLAQALVYLYKQRIFISDETDFARALDKVLNFFDDMIMLRNKVEKELGCSYEDD